MLQRDSDSRRLFSSRETFSNDCEMGASCVEVDVVCLCEAGPCTLYSEAHTPPPPPPPPPPTPPTPDTRLCEHCGKSRVTMTRFSEGYGTEEECLLSDPQGESDADADIEDTDCRLHEPGSLQRISSRRRKRPRVSRQDTTESEDDGGGGRSHASHRWNLRLSPDRGHSRTILEESISQVRPLIICRPNAERPSSDADLQRGSKPTSLWPTSLSLPLVLLLSLPLSLSLAVVLFLSFFLPSWASA